MNGRVVQIGLLLPTRDYLLGHRPAGDLVTLAVETEEAGLDSVWVGDSPLARPRHDPFAMLAAVSTRTTRVRLGTAVYLAPLRHPVLVLHQAATIDQLSGGRLIVGLGAGYNLRQTRRQFEVLDASFERRTQRVDDTLSLASHLWRGGHGPFVGHTFNWESPQLLPSPIQPGGPRLWLAGGGPRGLRRVGALADGWLPYPPTPDMYASDLADVTRAAQAACRASPVAAMYATVAIGSTEDLARRQAVASIERYYGLPFDAVRRVQAVYTGPWQGFVDWLGAYAEAGATHVVVRFAGAPPLPSHLRELATVRDALNGLSRSQP